MGWTSIKILALSVFSLYIIAVIILYALQHKFIFFPNALAKDYQFQGFSNFEEVVLEESATRYWHALHFKKKGAKGIVIYLHGNTTDLQQWGPQAEDFRKHDYEVLMLDYPTFGKSRGRLTESEINKMALKAYDFCRKLFDEKNIIILGRSVGTGPATTLATKVNSKLLILETPYTSIPDIAAKNWRVFPVRQLSRFRFNTLENIVKTKSPVLIFHGTKDELIPYEMGVAVAQKKGTLITIEGAEHNNFCESQLYLNTLVSILE